MGKCRRTMTPQIETTDGEKVTKTQGTHHMDDAEFWQKVALEAIVRGDDSKALAMRLEEKVERATCYPRQEDNLVVKNLSNQNVFDHMLSLNDFEFEDVETLDDGKQLVTGVRYTDHKYMRKRMED